MVNLIINGVSIDFIGTHNPINFYYNLTENRFLPKEGELVLKEIYYKGNIINNINDIKLKKDNFELDLSSFNNVSIKIENNLLWIILKYNNIFDIFSKATIFFNNIFEGAFGTYNCFSTSMNCNLSCPYCIYSCDNHIRYPKTNFHLGNYYIKSVIDTIDSICKPKYETIRIMGGETLININDFKNTVKYAKNVLNKKLKDMWIYTNLTINVNEFIKVIDKYLEDNISEKITIIFTSDSFDYTKSKRITNENIMKKYISNVKNIIDHYKNNDRVLTASNLMYIDYDECYNTAKRLYDLGLKFLQISYDEFTDRSIANDITKDVHNIYCRLENEGIKRLKQNLGTTMWYHFFINNGSENIYQCKYSFKADYVISKLNNY